MRITGGKARGRKIPPSGDNRLRPTPELVRKALFDILPEMTGLSFLDLFAGTGAVGIEALSRGAVKAVFVERNRRSAEAIRRSLEEFGWSGRGKVLALPVSRAVAALREKGETFDVVFADPPYEEGYVGYCCDLCLRGGLLGPGGVLVIQHSIHEEYDRSLLADQGVSIEARRYGDTVVTFLEVQTQER